MYSDFEKERVTKLVKRNNRKLSARQVQQKAITCKPEDFDVIDNFEHNDTSIHSNDYIPSVVMLCFYHVLHSSYNRFGLNVCCFGSKLTEEQTLAFDWAVLATARLCAFMFDHDYSICDVKLLYEAREEFIPKFFAACDFKRKHTEAVELVKPYVIEELIHTIRCVKTYDDLAAEYYISCLTTDVEVFTPRPVRVVYQPIMKNTL